MSSGMVRNRIAVTVDSTCDPHACGMLVVARSGCACYTYHPPASARSRASLVVQSVLDWFKLPSRALDFVHLCRPSKGRQLDAVDEAAVHADADASRIECDYDDACSLSVSFPKDATLVQWGWTSL